VAKLADAQASGACIRKDVGVQVPPRPPREAQKDLTLFGASRSTSSSYASSITPSGAPSSLDDEVEPLKVVETSRNSTTKTKNNEKKSKIDCFKEAASGIEGLPGTYHSMTKNGLALKHQSEMLVANLRGRNERKTDALLAPTFSLAAVLPLAPRVPEVPLPPFTRAIGATGRIRACIKGKPVGSLLGWSTGPLSVTRHGAWMLLEPTNDENKPRRNDGHCSFTDDLRLRVTEALCTNLGLNFGDEVAILPMPAQGILALTHPARLLLGAPLYTEWMN
jgi:hypothetical protein